MLYRLFFNILQGIKFECKCCSNILKDFNDNLMFKCNICDRLSSFLSYSKYLKNSKLKKT